MNNVSYARHKSKQDNLFTKFDYEKWFYEECRTMDQI